MNWVQRSRVFLISFIAIFLIAMAVAFSVMRALLPHATGYIEDVQHELETQIGLPVTIKALDADMDWLTPRLKLIDLIVYKKNGKDILIQLSEVNFSLDYVDSLLYLFPVVGAIDLVGPELFIERHDNNRWVVQGYELSGDLTEKTSETSQLLQTLKNINYSLLDSHIYWQDYTQKTDLIELKGVDVKIESFLDYRNFDIKVNLPKAFGKTLQVTAELDGDILYPDELLGKIYINGSSLNIENCLSKLDFISDVDVSGLSDASIWIDFGKNKIKKISGELFNSDIEVSNSKRTNVIWNADNIDFLFLYRKLSNGWRIDVDQLIVTKGDQQWPHKSKLLLKKATDVETAFSADYLRLQDVIPLTFILSDIKNDETFKSLDLKGISGDFYNVNTKISENNKKRTISATFQDLIFSLKEEDITVQGMDGSIDVENNDIRLLLDSRDLIVDLPKTFRAPIELDFATGLINMNSGNHGFSMNSSYITVANADLNFVSRVDMKLSSESGFLDMQVDFSDVNTKSLRNYLPINVLSARLIKWTDDAINEGTVEKGSFVFRGEPENFPFYNSDGVMEVDFAVDDLNLHFLDGWPNLKSLDANIRFYNESLSIGEGTGVTQDSNVFDVKAVIPDLNNPLLTVTGKAKSDASNIQHYIWNSGLDDLLGNALNQFDMTGGSKLDFHLKTPLGDNDEVEVDGKITFVNAQLDYPALNYLLTDINGSLSFTEENMSADNIQAKSGKNKIAINVLSIDADDEREAVINLSGVFAADRLLNSFDWIPEDWVSGSSKWSADIHVPYTEKEYLVRVSAKSQLEDVVFNVSDGLRKKQNSDLPIEIEAFVTNDDLKVSASSLDRFSFGAIRDFENIWRTDIESDVVAGSVKFKQGVSTDSTVQINLDSLVLDALVSSDTKNGLDALIPTNIPSLEVEIKNLSWKQWEFDAVSLSSGWHPQGMLIKNYTIDAPSLHINGQGSWLMSWQHTHESNFKINVVSEDLGAALDAAGVITGLKKSTFRATSDWQWQGEPYAFSWDKVKGESVVTLRDGIMGDISPGSKGRLLGLFNILELPKRVSLDFKDVYKDGFAFNKASGKFKLGNGDAYSKQIDVKAAAANVRIFGRIGMQEQDYDLNVLVKPHSKGASFTGGTILGGPIVGAGIVLLQNIFKLDELAYDKYTITNSWESPVITRVSEAKDTDAEEVNP